MLFVLGEFINNIQKALTDLKKGKFILVFDSEKREGETDFIMASEFVNFESIKQMRKDGGGLIFLMISHEIGEKFQLPFLQDLFKSIEKKYPVLKALTPNDIPYDSKSSFSLYINHRETFTGITDHDRSLTMKRFSEMISCTKNMNITDSVQHLGNEFRSPGHVPICIASKNLLHERKGHTELAIALLEMAELIPAASGCEIMGDTGKALTKKDVISYAKKNDIVFLEGKEIIEAWKQWSK
jgi:3,4-dihydroxy 2-butanone 4-phosphate synthase